MSSANEVDGAHGEVIVGPDATAAQPARAARGGALTREEQCRPRSDKARRLWMVPGRQARRGRGDVRGDPWRRGRAGRRDPHARRARRPPPDPGLRGPTAAAGARSGSARIGPGARPGSFRRHRCWLHCCTPIWSATAPVETGCCSGVWVAASSRRARTAGAVGAAAHRRSTRWAGTWTR